MLMVPTDNKWIEFLTTKDEVPWKEKQGMRKNLGMSLEETADLAMIMITVTK